MALVLRTPTNISSSAALCHIIAHSGMAFLCRAPLLLGMPQGVLVNQTHWEVLERKSSSFQK